MAFLLLLVYRLAWHVDRIVVPHRAIRVDQRGLSRLVDNRRGLINQHARLFRVVEQVHHLADDVLIFRVQAILEIDIGLVDVIVELGILGDLDVEFVVLVAVHVVGPGQVEVPGMDFPLAGFGIVEVVEVLAERGVVVVNGLRDGLVAVVLFQVQVILPPLDRGFAIADETLG